MQRNWLSFGNSRQLLNEPEGRKSICGASPEAGLQTLKPAEMEELKGLAERKAKETKKARTPVRRNSN
jgi:hypothetical protein